MEKGRFTRPITKDGTITLTPALRAAHAQQCQHQDCEEGQGERAFAQHALIQKEPKGAPRTLREKDFKSFAHAPDDLGSPSGRISGVVKNTPSGVGLGVGVTATCGPAAESSWMRISRAKSSCTVLWQWLTYDPPYSPNWTWNWTRPAVAQSPDVLSDVELGCGDWRTAPVHGDAFLEVQVDGMVPAAAAVDVGPVLDLARLRDQLRDAVGVEGVRGLAVDLDGPREYRRPPGSRACTDR